MFGTLHTIYFTQSVIKEAIVWIVIGYFSVNFSKNFSPMELEWDDPMSILIEVVVVFTVSLIVYSITNKLKKNESNDTVDEKITILNADPEKVKEIDPESILEQNILKLQSYTAQLSFGDAIKSAAMRNIQDSKLKSFFNFGSSVVAGFLKEIPKSDANDTIKKLAVDYSKDISTIVALTAYYEHEVLGNGENIMDCLGKMLKKPLYTLKTLYIVAYNLESVNPAALDFFPELEHLTIASCANLTTEKAEDFAKHAPNLKELQFCMVYLTAIPNLTSLENLKILGFSYCPKLDIGSELKVFKSGTGTIWLKSRWHTKSKLIQLAEMHKGIVFKI